MIDNFVQFISSDWFLILSLFLLVALWIFSKQLVSKNKLEPVCLDEGDFSSSDFTNVSFQDISVQRAKFIKADLTNVVFDNVNLTGSDFSDAILTNTKFIDCVMTDVIIDKSKVKVLNPDWN